MLNPATTFQDVKKAGDGWCARCPAHDDHRASLSIGIGEAGRVLLKCHAGCDLDDILAAAHLEHSDLFPEGANMKPTIVATYAYHDQGGRHLFDVVRFVPKDFRQRRADGTWKMNGVRRVLYRLPELQGHTTAYIVEGEKDADRLQAIGLPATTNVGGAGKWKPEYVAQLKAATVEQVVIIADNDDPGRKHAEDVARSCHAAGLRVKVVALPDLPTKGDVSDWLDGHTKTELVTLVKATALYTPPSAEPPQTATKPKREKAKKQGRDVQFADIEPCPDVVNGAALLTDIRQTFERYLALPSHASIALALWTVHTFAFDAFFASPFLVITSPQKRCGKTVLLIVLGALVPRRMFAANVTPAVLFRTIEKFSPTLLIDEADTFIRENDELRGVLNSGHTRTTAMVIRAVGDDHDPRAFSTWCPKAIALIGKLPGTLADRAIEIPMRRRTAGEAVSRLRQDRIEDDCAALRQQARRWADDHLPALQEADPNVPSGLHDRAADCWRPLLAIADAADGPWPALARKAAVELSGQAEDDDAGAKLLTDIRTIFEDDGDPEVLGSTSIVEKLVAMEDRPWSEWSHGKPLSTAKLARMLTSYGIYSAGVVRIGTKTPRAYRRAAFLDAWTRYGAVEVQHRNNANESGHKSADSKCNTDFDCCTSQSATTPMIPGTSCAVADSQPLLSPIEEDEGEDGRF